VTQPPEEKWDAVYRQVDGAYSIELRVRAIDPAPNRHPILLPGWSLTPTIRFVATARSKGRGVEACDKRIGGVATQKDSYTIGDETRFDDANQPVRVDEYEFASESCELVIEIQSEAPHRLAWVEEYGCGGDGGTCRYGGTGTLEELRR